MKINLDNSPIVDNLPPQSFNNSRAAMPNNNGCQGFFYALTLAFAPINKRSGFAAPRVLPVVGGQSLETGTLQRISVADPLFFVPRPKATIGQHLQSAMVSKNNCQTSPVGPPAQAVSESLERVHEFINDWYVMDAEFIDQTRRDLRVWFLNNILEWEGNMGSTLSDQIVHYDILDELLTLLLINAFNQPAK